MKNTLFILIILAGSHFNLFSMGSGSFNEARAKHHRDEIARKFGLDMPATDRKDGKHHETLVQKPLQLFYVWDTIIESDTSGLSKRVTQTTNALGNILVMKNETWDGVTWVNLDRDTYTYDVQGNLLSDLYEVWWNENWENSTKYTYTYNPRGYLLAYLEQIWQGPDWINFWQMSRTLNENDDPVEMINQGMAGGAWENYSRFLYTYDNNRNVASDIYALWESNAWLNQVRRTYTYTEHGLMSTNVRELWNAGQWKGSTRYLFSYDANDNLTVTVTEIMQQSQWLNSSKSENSYGPHGEFLSTAYQVWSARVQNWENSYLDLASYDADINLVEELVQEWDTSGDIWINTERARYTYDARRNSTDGFYELWSEGNWVPASGYLDIYSQGMDIDYLWDLSRYHASFKSFPGSIDETLSADAILIYPNPATDWLTIEYPGFKPGSEVLVSVFNTLGILVLQQPLLGQKQSIALSALPSGLYLLKAGSGRNHSSKTFVRN